MTVSSSTLKLAPEAEARIDDLQRRYPTKAATLLFLDQHLKPGSKTKLSEEALTPYRRGAVKKVEVTFK